MTAHRIHAQTKMDGKSEAYISFTATDDGGHNKIIKLEELGNAIEKCC